MGTALFILVLCIVAFIALAWLRFGQARKETAEDQRAEWGQSARPALQMPPVPVAVFAWPELGDFDFEVVGESNYQLVLKALMDDCKDPRIDGRGTAILVPEDANPHDPKAVKVTVQGFTVGYLSREDARAYRRRLARKKLGMVPASCGLQITGGYPLKDGTIAHYGAVLDIKPFEDLNDDDN